MWDTSGRSRKVRAGIRCRCPTAREIQRAPCAREHALRTPFRLRKALHLPQTLENLLGSDRLRALHLDRTYGNAEQGEMALVAVAVEPVEPARSAMLRGMKAHQ